MGSTTRGESWLPGTFEFARGAGHGHDLRGQAAAAERAPESGVRLAPGAERGRRVVAGLGVDEQGARRVQRDGQLDGEMAPGRAGGSPVDLDGQQVALDPEGLERGDLSGGAGAARACAGRRSGVPALKAEAAADRR